MATDSEDSLVSSSAWSMYSNPPLELVDEEPTKEKKFPISENADFMIDKFKQIRQ